MRELLAITANEFRRAGAKRQFQGMSPEVFARDVLKVRLWSRQLEVAEAIGSGCREAYVKAGHGVGKTCLASVLATWALVCAVPAPIVLTTAPTWRQVEDQIWRELRMRWSSSPRLSSLAEPTRACSIELGPKHYAKGVSTNQPERFQGWHGERLFFVIDEANGFPSSIWTSVESCMTNEDAQLVALGNAVLPYGKFYDGFKGKVPGLQLFSISSREHPNVIEGREVIPGAVTRRWIADFEAKYPAAIVASRVDAIFPEGSILGIIKQEWLNAARQNVAKVAWPVVVSVDVARFGENATAVCEIRGSKVERIELSRQLSTMQVGRMVEARARTLGAHAVVVDDDGVGGGVTDFLRESGLPVVAFRGGMPAVNEERFFNAASEAWWLTREAFEAGALELGFYDTDLDLQLTCREYSLAADKRIRIEPKREYIARTNMPSPDHADALTMGVAQAISMWGAGLLK